MAPVEPQRGSARGRENLPRGRRRGRYRLDHSPDARGSETPCQPLRNPRTSLSL
jgi:hypothetical protein